MSAAYSQLQERQFRAESRSPIIYGHASGKMIYFSSPGFGLWASRLVGGEFAVVIGLLEVQRPRVVENLRALSERRGRGAKTGGKQLTPEQQA